MRFVALGYLYNVPRHSHIVWYLKEQIEPHLHVALNSGWNPAKLTQLRVNVLIHLQTRLVNLGCNPHPDVG